MAGANQLGRSSDRSLSGQIAKPQWVHAATVTHDGADAAALELDVTEPSITAAKAIAAAIARNGSVQRDTLLWVMEQAHGGFSADGRWSIRDAHDIRQLAEGMHLAKADLSADPGAGLAALSELVRNLPTHTVRNKEQSGFTIAMHARTKRSVRVDLPVPFGPAKTQSCGRSVKANE